MAGMRDKLIHEYYGVDLKVVWRTLKEEIPVLLPKVQQIIADHDVPPIQSDKK